MTTTTLVLVLVGFTIVGILLGRMTSTKSVDDFALGGRSMGFFPSLMTLSGTFVMHTQTGTYSPGLNTRYPRQIFVAT